jgi:hypothetical protein
LLGEMLFSPSLLRTDNEELESGIMERAVSENIDYEKDFENWLENSPSVLLDDDEGSTVLWIGRQVTATVGDIGKYPDLLGIDANGDLVVELKKGKTPARGNCTDIGICLLGCFAQL